MKSAIKLISAAALLLTVSACGDDDPVGPPVTADVHSVTFTFSADDADINGSVASVQFDVPSITPSVVDGGAVLVYFREQGTWTAMPYTFAQDSPDLPAVDYTVTLGYGYDDEFLELFYEASTEEVDLRLQPDRVVKAVIVDGYVLSKSGVDLTDYEAVKRYFGLND
ncbi:MAG: hypothetical protein WED81_06765 [Rhodothermales bacterium]